MWVHAISVTVADVEIFEGMCDLREITFNSFQKG